MTKTEGSRSISSQIPCRMASTKVATPPREGRFDLCSFLVAVDIDFGLLVPPEDRRAEGGGDDRVVEDVKGGLLRLRHRRGLGPGRVFFDFPFHVGDYLIKFFLRGDAVRKQ